MGASRIPLYAYVDETGNTGHNLFDEAQPDFFTAALITNGDFDLQFARRTKMLANSLGEAQLHGKELGIRRIEESFRELIDLLYLSRARFYVCRVEKKYLIVTKLFDTIFDSGENAAVAWHHYNIK